MTRGKALAVLLALMGGLVALARPSAAQTIDAKRGQASALEAKISSQGERLSIADEAYNQAQVQTQKVAADATSARSQAHAAEVRYGQLRERLARRVRLLYMNPGAPIEAFLGATSLSEMERGRVLGSSVLTADTALVMRTERARKQVFAQADRLEKLQKEAAGKEQLLNGRRIAVGSELTKQRALLSDVKGEIATLLEQQRAQELAQAQQEVQTQQQRPDVPNAIPNSQTPSGGPAGTPSPQEAPAPPPPVSSGASKAVATARAQIGKPYQWAAAGPDSFDCSGLTM